MYFQSATKHDLDLVYGKVVISVVQLLQLAENCPVSLSSSLNSSVKNVLPKCNQTWFRPCLWKSGYFCSSTAATCWKLSSVPII